MSAEATQQGPDGTTKHACARCGEEFWFASNKPTDDWTCDYCAPGADVIAFRGDDTDELVREACDHADDEDDVTATALSALALSAVLEVAETALRNAIDVRPEVLELPELVEALNRLRGDTGIIGTLRIVERDIENAIVDKLPKVERGRYAGRPQKHTLVDGWDIERNSGGQWTIDSEKALRRLFADMPELTPELAADLVVQHISSIDRHWRTTELEESLGGPLVRPVTDEKGEPVVYQSGAKKGLAKTEKVNRLEAEEWGERSEGRDTVRITKGDADG